MTEELSEVHEEDGVFYLVPKAIDLPRPTRDAGRFPRTTRELGCRYHPELVSWRSLLESLARGERKEELLQLFESGPDELVKAFSGLVLSSLYAHGQGARAQLSALLTEPRLTAKQQSIVRDVAWNLGVEREREDERLAAFVSVVPQVTQAPHDPVQLWATASSDGLGAHERRAAFETLTREDRATACALARELTQDRDLGRVARHLLRFPEVADLHAHLSMRGLRLMPGARWQETVLSCFTVLETSQWLADKDDDGEGQATMLARLTGLDEVVFESIPALGPHWVEEEDDAPIGERLGELSRLRAYQNGRCDEALIEGGRYLDLMGVVGLLNTLLERRGDERRWIFPEPLGESLEGMKLVVAWPLATIRALSDDGLL